MSPRKYAAHKMNRAILLAAIAITQFLAPSIVPDACGKTNLAKGEELFAWKCAKCHGAEGVGQDPINSFGGWKDNGKRIPPALNGTGHAWNHSTRELFSYIKNGSIDRNSSMRPHKEMLSDYEIICIIQYVRALWPEEITKKHLESFGPDRNDTDQP